MKFLIALYCQDVQGTTLKVTFYCGNEQFAHAVLQYKSFPFILILYEV